MTGELAALSSAFLWALAAIGYGALGRRIPALGLNLAKGVVAIALLCFTLLLRRELGISLEFSSSLELTNTLLLLLSGILGIGVGDSFYFGALQFLGARRTLLLGTLSPPITAFLSLLFLKEVLPVEVWFGIGLTIAGVIWVISERVTGQTEDLNHLVWGISLGLLSALSQAIGAVLSRAALAESDISPLWAALLRLSAGVVVLLLWGLARQNLGQWLKGFNSVKTITILWAAAFAGTYLGIWLQQIALKYTDAGIAQTLSATSPLFILPIAALLGERISLRAILGALLAVAGIVILFYGR